MAHKAATKNPDECREMFEQFAILLDIYARDQDAFAMRHARPGGPGATECTIRAEVYRGIAQEMREIEWIKEK